MLQKTTIIALQSCSSLTPTRGSRHGYLNIVEVCCEAQRKMANDIPSTMELPYDEAHGNDIIRVASYHRRDYDLAVIRVDPLQHETVRSSMTHPFKRTAMATVGRLDNLPLEILHEILLFLDVESLFLFRQVNLRARQIVSTVRGYQPLVDHALEAVCVILRTKISSWYTLQALFDVFRTRDCPLCGCFGGFVFLPSFKRSCFNCLTAAPQFRVLSVTEAGKHLNLSPRFLRKSIPFLRTIPGIYSMDETPRKKRMYLMAEQKIAKAFASSNTRESRALPGSANRETALGRFLASTTLPYLDRASGDVQHGICCTGCQIVLEGGVRSDLLAGACALRDSVYSRAEFLGHFKRCSEAQALWMLSEEGTIAVKVPESVRRGGYFNERDVVMSFRKRNYQDIL